MSRAAICVTGASGLVGRALAAKLPTVGLPRRDPGDGSPWWDPGGAGLQASSEPIAGIVHLAGENVAARRWNPAHKAAIRDSRVLGSRALVDSLRARSQRPAVMVAASAVGLYGDRGDEPLTEAASSGGGFLAEVTEAWEAELRRVEELGIRLVVLRIGVALSREGGALPKMLPAFRAGLGGRIGSGQQWFPWVHLDDVVGVIAWALRSSSARGAYNVVAPGVVRQAEFARALGRTLQRPARLPVPGRAMRLLFGELAEEGLLASTRAVPARLVEEGYRFEHPELSGALAALLR